MSILCVQPALLKMPGFGTNVEEGGLRLRWDQLRECFFVENLFERLGLSGFKKGPWRPFARGSRKKWVVLGLLWLGLDWFGVVWFGLVCFWFGLDGFGGLGV